jgi:hypothetical protein
MPNPSVAQTTTLADPRAAGRVGQGGGNLLGAGHLRHALGVDEGDGLHAPGAGGLQPADEVELLIDLQQGLFVL